MAIMKLLFDAHPRSISELIMRSFQLRNLGISNSRLPFEKASGRDRGFAGKGASHVIDGFNPVLGSAKLYLAFVYFLRAYLSDQRSTPDSIIVVASTILTTFTTTAFTYNVRFLNLSIDYPKLGLLIALHHSIWSIQAAEMSQDTGLFSVRRPREVSCAG
jgi:hypothetical protein